MLVALVGHASGPRVILTHRTPELEDHADEISLPGGRIEVSDAGPVAAALREAQEEIGLPTGRVDVLGCLRPYDTITGFRIQPVVGWVDPPVELYPDPAEVADVFEVPLAFVLDPVNHHRGSLLLNGVTRNFYVLPYPHRHIWGATAGILVDLARVVGPRILTPADWMPPAPK